jgi:DNA-binding beta-propeller fold protein YncE
VAGWPAGYPEPGLLAMYKLNDGTLLDTIWLDKFDPSAMAFANGKLYVASAGQYDASGATLADDARGIEVVDLEKKKSTVVVDGTKLGGGVSAFVIDAKNNVAYAAIYKNYGSVPLVQVDLATKKVKSISGVSDVEGGLAFDAAAGTLYIGDRTYGSEAVYVYKADKVSKLDAGSDVLPPYSITILK